MAKKLASIKVLMGRVIKAWKKSKEEVTYTDTISESEKEVLYKDEKLIHLVLNKEKVVNDFDDAITTRVNEVLATYRRINKVTSEPAILKNKTLTHEELDALEVKDFKKMGD